MRRAFTIGSMLLLALTLTACGGNDKATKATGSTSASPTTVESASGSPTEAVTEETTAPTEDVSSAPPTDAPAGAGVDGCAVVTEELLTTDLGFAPGGQLISQPSSFDDPASKDCFYAAAAGDLIAVKATSRPDTDMPEGSNSTASLPGAVAIDGVDWGSIYILSPSPTVASVVFVKGDVGLDMSISTVSDVTMDQLQTFAADIVASLG
jgi:hypothetical protein